jgi:hypothetical protein
MIRPTPPPFGGSPYLFAGGIAVRCDTIKAKLLPERLHEGGGAKRCRAHEFSLREVGLFAVSLRSAAASCDIAQFVATDVKTSKIKILVRKLSLINNAATLYWSFSTLNSSASCDLDPQKQGVINCCCR